MEWTKEMCDEFMKAVDDEVAKRVEGAILFEKTSIANKAYDDGHRKGFRNGKKQGYHQAMLEILDYTEAKLTEED